MRVIKLGGNDLDRPGFLRGLASSLLASSRGAVVVHGGGMAVDMLQERLGVQPMKVDGLRITDDESLQAVVMALCGSINKQIVAELVGQGVDALGLSGVDGGLLRVRRLDADGTDLGWVGEITDVRVDLLELLLGQGMTPVVAPVSIGPGNHLFNVNADQAAAAIASALGVESLDFVSNVEGVTVDGRLLSTLSDSMAAQLIAEGKISGGMVPKVKAALQALSRGVPVVRIVDLGGLSSASGGTRLSLERAPGVRRPASSEAPNEA